MLEWFESLAGPAFAPALMWTLLSLVGLVLVLVVVRLVRGLIGGTFIAGGRNRKARLAVMDAAAVDDTRRLVLVRRDDVEHLILIGGNSDIVIEQNIRLYGTPRRAVTHEAQMAVGEASEFEAEPQSAPTPPTVAPAVQVREIHSDRPVERIAPEPQVMAEVDRAPQPAAPEVAAVPERAPYREPQTARVAPATPPRPAAPAMAPSPRQPAPDFRAEPRVVPQSPSPTPRPTAPSLDAAPAVQQRPARPDPVFDVMASTAPQAASVASAAAPAVAASGYAPSAANGREPSFERQTYASAQVPEPNASERVHATPDARSVEDDLSIDDALLQELEVSLEDDRAEAQTQSRAEPDDSLDEEMSRLLGELSGQRR